jgi:6,7-dimethyl-8-ribityllumazine synthase
MPSVSKNNALSSLPTVAPEPDLDGSRLRIGIVAARYNWDITGTMLQCAQDELLRLRVVPEKITVVVVPGAYELAIAAQSLLRQSRFDALICFGCVMKGETRHDVVISDAAAQGIQRVALDAHVPIIFGVMCVEDRQQAKARVSRGAECARSAVEMASIVGTGPR